MEVGIAAALSGDPKLQEAYRSGDCYLEFAKQAGAVPPDAIREDYEDIRDRYKTCVLGVQYGMKEITLALRIGCPPIVARELLREHRETYPVFWRWSEAAVAHAMLFNNLYTVYGWTVHAGMKPNSRSMMNFPMQANGAEIMRLAACLATERGAPIGGVVHDAFAVCTRIERYEHDKAIVETAMREASRIVLGGFELGVETKPVHWPDRYMDKRGRVMWEKTMALLERQQLKRRVA
jgi:DNA polymerase I-like protein with 3'-5' exonuclease and polymerase domains